MMSLCCALLISGHFEEKQKERVLAGQARICGELLRLLKPSDKERMPLVADLIELFERLTLMGMELWSGQFTSCVRWVIWQQCQSAIIIMWRIGAIKIH